MTPPDAVVFLATFPDIQTAVKVGRDSIRIQLDIPASERTEAMKLLEWQHEGCVLQVVIKPE